MGAKKITSEWASNRLLNGSNSLGNTGQSILDKVSELLNDYCRTEKQDHEIADLAGLSVTTIRRLKDRTPTELEHEYDPMGDTMSRVLVVFGAQITWSQVNIKSKFMPQPKMKLV